jgi:hypothetical protein
MNLKRGREEDSDSEDGGGYGYGGQQPKVSGIEHLRTVCV